MIMRMAFARTFSSCLLALSAAACAGIAPDPAFASIEGLAQVALSVEDIALRDRLEAEAIDAVVRRRYDQAKELAVRVVEIDPRAARARAVLGMVKLQAAAQQQPIEWFGQRSGEFELALARQLGPNDAFVGWMHAVFLAESGHMSAAAAAAEEALARAAQAPESERAALLGTAGTYRYELGEERAALPHLQIYVGMRPDDATAHFRLGVCLLGIANTPQVPVAYAVAQAKAEDAVRAFARCYELAPGDEDAALAVAAALLRAAELADSGKPKRIARRDELRQQASDHLRELAAKFAANPEVHFRLALVATLQGEVDLARASYVAALERDEHHVGSLLNLAAMHAAGGDRDQAVKLFTRLLAAPTAQTKLTRDERRRIERWLKLPADGSTAAAGG